jgi:hypothetical protein
MADSHAAALGSPVARRLNSRYLGVLVSVRAWSIRARFAEQGCRPFR